MLHRRHLLARLLRGTKGISQSWQSARWLIKILYLAPIATATLCLCVEHADSLLSIYGWHTHVCHVTSSFRFPFPVFLLRATTLKSWPSQTCSLLHTLARRPCYPSSGHSYPRAQYAPEGVSIKRSSQMPNINMYMYFKPITPVFQRKNSRT